MYGSDNRSNDVWPYHSHIEADRMSNAAAGQSKPDRHQDKEGKVHGSMGEAVVGCADTSNNQESSSAQLDLGMANVQNVRDDLFLAAWIQSKGGGDMYRNWQVSDERKFEGMDTSWKSISTLSGFSS